MIVVDTNVVSEVMRAEPDPAVLAWTASVGRVHTTAITIAEIGYGIARLPDGRRRDRLTALATTVFASLEDVILPFDDRAARRYGRLVAERERAGRPITVADAQIAAICVERAATLATRNGADFAATGLELINPWDS